MATMLESGTGGDVDSLAEQLSTALDEIGGTENCRQDQDRDESDAFHQVEAAEPPGHPYQDDYGRGTRGDGAHGGVGARRHGVDDVLGHDAEVQRDRDHVSDRDHHVASCFESLARAVEIIRLGEWLDHPDVVADRGAHHPSNGGDRNRADDREPTERALQHRNDDQESAPEDRGEGRDRGAR